MPATTSIDTRSRLAAKAFAHTARYDTTVASYLQQRSGVEDDGFDAAAGAVFRQTAGPALRRKPASARRVLPQSGRAWRLGHHRQGAAGQGPVLQQHRRQRCGHRVCAPVCAAAPASSSSTPTPAAWRSAPRRSRPTPAPIAPTRPPPSAASSPSIASSTPPTARAIIERQFAEVIAAPAVTAGALAALAAKPNLRLLATGALNTDIGDELEFRSVTGGLLLQQRDSGRVDAADLQDRQPPSARGARARRPDVRLAGGQVREIQRHRTGAWRRHTGRRRRSDEPRVLHAHRGVEGGRRKAAMCAARSWHRTRSFRFAMASMSRPPMASRRSSIRVARCAIRK